MIEKMEEPTSDSMFYSPTFKRYESVTFYANLLSILKQYTQIIDQCPSTIRKLVWSHIFQLLGQPQRPCDQMFTPVINSWLNEKSVDLMDIETYFAAFTQAQVENPSIFPNLPPVPNNTFSIPGISAPATSVRVSKNHLSNMLSQISTPSTSANSSPVISSPPPQHHHQSQPQPQQLTPSKPIISSTPISSPKSPSKPITQSPNIVQQQQQQQQQLSQQLLQQSIIPPPQQPPQNQTSVWSTELSSVFSQLALLQSWSAALDRLSPISRELIWRTCRYIQQFNNYDKSSFVKTIHLWTVDPIPNLAHITVMFASVGYLKEMGAIKGDFNYSNSAPVFGNPIHSNSEMTPPMSPSYELSSDNTPDYSVSPPSSPRIQRPSQQQTILSTTSLSMSNYSSPVHTPSSTPLYLSPRPLSDVPISPKQQQLQSSSASSPSMQLPGLTQDINSKKRKSIEALLHEHSQIINNLIKLERDELTDEEDEDDAELNELKLSTKLSEESIIKVNSYHGVGIHQNHHQNNHHLQKSLSPIKKLKSSNDGTTAITPSPSSSSPVESRSSISSILCS